MYLTQHKMLDFMSEHTGFVVRLFAKDKQIGASERLVLAWLTKMEKMGLVVSVVRPSRRRRFWYRTPAGSAAVHADKRSTG